MFETWYKMAALIQSGLDLSPTDLSLMVLGNMVTNLINTSIAPAQRQAIANSFARALQSSVNDDQAH